VGEYRVGATIEGLDGVALGTVDTLIIDPTNHRVTNLVVSHDRLGPRLLIPVTGIVTAGPDTVVAEMSIDDLHRCERFDLPDFNEPGEDWSAEDLVLDPGSYFLEPFASPLDGYILATHERIPKGEVPIRRGAEVLSSDGTKVGHVDEFLVDPQDGLITHVVLRRGHVFKHDDDIVIPVTSATKVEDGRVVLDMGLEQVDGLERIPVTRHGHVRR